MLAVRVAYRRSVRSLSTASTLCSWDGNICSSTVELTPSPPYASGFTETVSSGFAGFGDKLAIVDGVTGEQRTFAELSEDTEAVAQSLSELGIGKGDVIGLYTPNHVDFFASFHGAARLGAAVTLLNPLYTKYEITSQLQGSRAKALISHSACIEAASGAAQELEGLHHLIQIGDAAPAGGYSLEDLKRDGRGAAPLPPTPVDGEGLCCLPYSSGTTGLPKGTMLSHNNLIANLHQADLSDGRFWDQSKDVLISPLPFFHIYAFLFSVQLAAFKGCTLVTMPRFDLERFCELVQDYKCTRSHLVPPILLGLAKSPAVDQYDLSSLENIISAAAPLGGELEGEVVERLGCTVKQAWGMSELSPLGTLIPDDAVKPVTSSDDPCSNPPDPPSWIGLHLA